MCMWYYLFNDIFVFAKQDECKPAFRLTKKYPVYDWVTNMVTQWTTRWDNQAQGRKKEHIGRFNLFLHRGINTVHKFACACNAFSMHVTYTIVTVHAIYEGLPCNKVRSQILAECINRFRTSNLPVEKRNLELYSVRQLL